MSGQKVINIKGEVPLESAGATAAAQLIPRASSPQGAYSGLFNGERRNAIMPGLYEALREAIPMLDTAINNFNMLDGAPVVVGENKAVVEALNQFLQEVQVGDNQYGMAAYTASMRDETHEQGFAISEPMLGDKGIYRLNVADSKAMHAARKDDGTLAWYFNPHQKSRLTFDPMAKEQVAQILQNRTPINIAASFLAKKGFVELDPSRMNYMAYRVENSDAYGVSMLRSMPVFAETFLTIINAIDNTWERFGDPSFHIAYKSGRALGDKKDANGDTPLEARRKALAAQLQSAVRNKRKGHSADFATAVDKDSEVSISIIGAEGMVLDASVPLTKVVEQITSGTGQPPWMLNVSTGATQGMSKYQSEVMQQGSANRTHRESLLIERLCKTHLRALGLTWSEELIAVEDAFSMNKTRLVRKDWRIEYHKPNLSDIVAKAQANFMNTQSDILRDRTGEMQENTNAPISISTESADGEKTNTTHNLAPSRGKPSHQLHNKKQPLKNLETRPIENPALDTIENDALKSVFSAWDETINFLIVALGLESNLPQTATKNGIKNAMQSEGFSFTKEDKALLANELALFVSALVVSAGLYQGALMQAYVRAWSQGVIDGYLRSGLDAPIGAIDNSVAVDRILKTSSESFTSFTAKLTPRVHAILEAGAAAGENPINIAANLRREMGGAKWKWEQIARSEIAMAWDEAKRGEWQAEIADGVIDDQFDFIPAPDGCPQCQTQAEGNPRTLANTPKPVVDTHPSCRCDLLPHIKGES